MLRSLCRRRGSGGCNGFWSCGRFRRGRRSNHLRLSLHRRRGGRRLRDHDTWSLTRLRRNQSRSWGSWNGGQFFLGLGFGFNAVDRLLNLRRRADRGCSCRRGRNRWRLRGCGSFRNGSCRFGCNRSRGSCNGRCWTHRRRRFDGGRWNRTRRRCRRSMLLLQNGFQCIAGLGDVREVELRLQLFLAVTLRRRLRRGTISSAGAEMCLHLLRFIDSDGTGVSFLFCDADLREHVKNGLALDFELSR